MDDLKITIKSNMAELTEYILAEIIKCLKSDIETTGQASIVLAGGATYQPVYQLLAKRSDEIDWTKVQIFIGDDRAVPLDHPDCNFSNVKKAWFDRVKFGLNVHRIEGERGAVHAATSYQEEIAQYLGQNGQFSLVLLGVGADGHSASLFAGSLPEIRTGQLVVATNPEAPPFVLRTTLTPVALRQSKQIIVTLTGVSKKSVYHHIRSHATGWPIDAVVGTHKNVEFVFDAAASN